MQQPAPALQRRHLLTLDCAGPLAPLAASRCQTIVAQIIWPTNSHSSLRGQISLLDSTTCLIGLVWHTGFTLPFHMQSLFQLCVYCFDTTMASYKVTAASERSPSIEAPRAPQMGATVRAAARWRTEQLVRSIDCAAALSGQARPTVAHLAQVVSTHTTLCPSPSPSPQVLFIIT